MRLALVGGVIGYLLRRFSIAFLAPMGLALWDAIVHGESLCPVLFFFVALVVTVAVSYLLSLGFESARYFRRSEALGVVAGTWLSVAIVGGLPYLLAGLTPVDAFFESMSGFTTTGATILTNWEYCDAFFLWRSMTQWFGGLGVIALFVVVLPRLGIAGRQLFFAEASAAAGDAISPQIRESARRLWILYVALTSIQAVLLVVTGMSVYDGVVHALTTMSAGGFSPNPESIQGYHNVAAEWVFIVFMVFSGTSFTLQYRGFTGKPLAFVRDREFMTYFVIMILIALGVGALLTGGTPTLDSIRTGGFQVASLMSSTGFASADFNLWSDALKALLIVAMVVGGCAGSACGGPKVIRYILTAKWLRREVTQVLHPRAVIPLRYGRVGLPDEVMRAVTTLVFLYVALYAALGAAVCVMETDVDLVTGFSASLACLGNIGPGFGAVGPMNSYAGFSVATKILLSFSMWIGRLEIVTVIALLHPHVWRNLQWRGDTRNAGS